MDACQHQVIDQSTETTLFLCVVYKDYFQSCPSKCPYYRSGSPLTFAYLYSKNFDFECTYFQSLVQCTAHDSQSFICELTKKSPDCPNCPLKLVSNSGVNSGVRS